MFWEGWNFLIPLKSEKILQIGEFPSIPDRKLSSQFHEKLTFLEVDEAENKNYLKTKKFLESLKFHNENFDYIFINADLLKINFEKIIEKCISILKSKGMIFVYSSRKITKKFLMSSFSNERDSSSFFLLGFPRPNSILFPDTNLQVRGKVLKYIQQIKYRNKRVYYFFYLLRFLSNLNLFEIFFRHKLFVFVKSELSGNSPPKEKNSYELLTQENSAFVVLPVKRKNIVTVFSSDGSLESFSKFSSGEQGEEIIENEVKILQYLADYEFDTAIVPKIVSYQTNLERSFLEISPKSVLKFPKRMCEIHVDWLIELFSKTSTLALFKESAFFPEIHDKLKVIKFYFHDQSSAWLDELCEDMVSAIHDLNLPFGLVQREFPFYHACLIGDSKKLFVFDWEFGRANYPPLFDLFHCLLSDKYISGAGNVLFPDRVTKTLFDSKQSQVFIKRYLEGLNLSSKIVYPLFILFLIDQLACYLPFVNELEEVRGHWDALQKLKNKSSFSLEKWTSTVSVR